MKLIEVLVMLVLLPVFSMSVSSNIKVLAESRKRFSEKYTLFCADKTISSSFVKLCEKSVEDEAEIDTFLKNSSLLWSLDSIDVKTLGMKDKKKLLKCEWRRGTHSSFVLAISEN